MHLLFLLSGELGHQPNPSLDLCSNVPFLGHSISNSTPSVPYPPHSTYFPAVIVSILSSLQEMTSEHQTPYLALSETKETFPTPGQGTMLGMSSRGRQRDTGGVQACAPRRHPHCGQLPPAAPGPHPRALPSTRWPTASDAHGEAPPTDSPPGPHQPSRMQPCGKLRFHPLSCGLPTPVLERAGPLCSLLPVLPAAALGVGAAPVCIPQRSAVPCYIFLLKSPATVTVPFACWLKPDLQPSDCGRV